MPSKRVRSEVVFNCTQCGECCKGFGGTFVSEGDILNIADYLETTPENVLAKYCQISGGKPLLATGENGYCIFWNKNCSIHSIKPSMCRAWPYIASVLIDPANWRAMGSCCPGIKKNASEESILAVVQSHLGNIG